MDKIFANLRKKVDLEEKIFHDYCKDNFLGKDYNKLMYLLDKK